MRCLYYDVAAFQHKCVQLSRGATAARCLRHGRIHAGGNMLWLQQ